ncbi:MAG: DNA translocase FtsK [Gemmataceae bacterium]
MPDTPAPPRWRLDAVAVTLIAAWAAVAGSVLTYPPLTGLAPALGPAGSELAAALVNPLGIGVGVLLLGWAALVARYVAREGWPRLAGRAAGWAVLTATAAVIADAVPAVALGQPVSAFGPGGSVGAAGRLLLDARLHSPLPAVGLAAVALCGLTLAADGLVRAALHAGVVAGGRLARGAVRGNTLVGRIGDRVIETAGAILARLRRPKPDLVTLSPLPVCVPLPTPALEKPGTHMDRGTHTEEDPDAGDDGVADIPITRPVDLSHTPPPLRVLPAQEPDEPDEPDEPTEYTLPPISLLADPDPFPVEDHEQKLRDRAVLLEKTFADFGLVVRVVGIHTGPVITQYEVALDTGLRLNKVTTLADDLALNLGVSAVRIVAPLPGRTTVGIEVPNDHRQTVRLKELIHASAAKAAKFKLPIFLGKDVEGRPLVYDMATMPHLLIAGRTGTGKSVCLNAVILSFLFTRTPDECRMILIDPKKVELSEYGKVPHLMHPVVTDDKKAEAILAWAVDKMEERYEMLRRARVRNIASYNELGWDEILRRVNPESEEERQQLPRTMPYIVIVVDEVGDLIMSMKKEVESHIIRLAQKSRAAGIHLILATQKPTVDVITGLIKSNLPARICFQVASRADSAVVLDEKGAERLLNKGDMLFLQPGTSSIIRAQGAYVDDQEIVAVVEALEVHEPHFESELLNLKARDTGGNGAEGEFADRLRDRDPLYEQAIEIVVREQRGSTSLLQRALGVGYGRASRLIDFMAEDGIVGSFNGSSARDVLVTPEEWEGKKRGA